MTSETEYNCINCGQKMIHTSATPSADTLAGLVPVANGVFANGNMVGFVGLEGFEFKLTTDIRERHPVVRYSEAAAVVAAKDAEIEKLKQQVKKANTEKSNFENLTNMREDGIKTILERRDALEDELAKIKAQEPVATVELRASNGRRVKHVYPINLDNVAAGSPLYAVPVSDSIRVEAAKLAKYCEWYDSVDELGAFPDIQDVMVPLGDLRALRAALKGGQQ